MSRSKNHYTQVVSSLSLEVFKEGVPASGEEVGPGGGGGGVRRWGFWGAEPR